MTINADWLRCLTSIELFSARVLRRPLRAYQLAPARAILDSVLQRRGLTLAVMMARQAGKNETAAHIEALLLSLFQRSGGNLVKAAPTFRPQTLISLQRLQSVLERYPLGRAQRERGYILRLGRARAYFLSAHAEANVVGATANLLLEADEAQDMDALKWDKDFRPMGAAGNVTTVLWGTAWSADTLLARTIRALRQAEGRDQVRRVFIVPWEQVAREVPAYGEYVRGEIARLGPEHPLIRSQYGLEELQSEAGMFPVATQALMRGAHLRERAPTPGREYAFTLDVAGEAEQPLTLELLEQAPRRQDASALTILEIVREEPGLTRYLVRDRYVWQGQPHHALYSALLHLAALWEPRYFVVDATGVGAGLASFLRQRLGSRVTPFIFGQASKSELGWSFLGLCNSARFQDHRDDGSPEAAQFWREVQAADYEVLCGPGQAMRWGVADPAVHDDLLLSAALCAVIERQHPAAAADPSLIIEAEDPLRSGGGTHASRI